MSLIGHTLGADLRGRHPSGVSVFVHAFLGGVEDDYGNTVEGWSAQVQELRGCAFDPGSISEPRLQGHERVIVEPTLYVGYAADVNPRDRIEVEGLLYEVVGEPRRWRSPFTGKKPGTVISLRRVEG